MEEDYEDNFNEDVLFDPDNDVAYIDEYTDLQDIERFQPESSREGYLGYGELEKFVLLD